jgi:hypothetical protein
MAAKFTFVCHLDDFMHLIKSWWGLKVRSSVQAGHGQQVVE